MSAAPPTGSLPAGAGSMGGGPVGGGAVGRGRAVLQMVLRRLGFAVPVLALVALGVFLLGAASPFDPIYQYYGVGIFTASDADIERVRQTLDLDAPVLVQFTQWVGTLLAGELGHSRSMRQPVIDVLVQRVPWSLLLTATGLVLAVVFALVLGVLTAWRQGGWLDRVVTSVAHALEGLPSFVIALIAVAVVAIGLGWLPAGGLTDSGVDASLGQVARHLVLPATVLGISQAPWLVLHLRASMLASLAEDHVTGARSRGLAEHVVVLRHALPTASLPLVTLLGARLPELVTGAVLVEAVFSWPGIASATVTAALNVDFPLLAAVTLLATATVLLGALLADVAVVLLDPRVRADG